MTNHLVVIKSDSVIHKALCATAQYQFGAKTNVSVWLTEVSNHGDSYHGFDSNAGKWLQVDLANVIDASLTPPGA